MKTRCVADATQLCPEPCVCVCISCAHTYGHAHNCTQRKKDEDANVDEALEEEVRERGSYGSRHTCMHR